MESCATETGLLKKKPCGQPAVAKCDNCEMPLCSRHAVPQLSSTKQRTGKFMCAECARAHSEAEKAAPRVAPKPAATPKPAAVPKPAASAAKPAAAPAKPQENSDGSIEFTPGKK